MTIPPLETFIHRQNEDGTHDSICLYCYRTIANARLEAELSAPENLHSCRQKLTGHPGVTESSESMEKPLRPVGELRQFRRQTQISRNRELDCDGD